MLVITKTVAPVEQNKHIAHSQCDVTKTIRIHRYPKHLFQNREDLFFMKNKTKVVLGLAAMLAGTVGVAGVSTFAWFTTQNTATVSFADAHVVSDNASIVVQYEAIANNGIDSSQVTAGRDTAGGTVTITGASVDCRDISGNGKNFYRPHWTTYPTAADTMQDLTISSFSSSKTYWVEYGIDVTNKGAAGTKLFLGHGSTVTGGKTTASQNERAARSTRIAIWSGAATGTQTDLMSIWQYDKTDHTAGYKFLEKKTGTAYGLTTYNLSTVAAATLVEGEPVGCAYTDTAATKPGQYLGTFVNQNDVIHLTISMWIEGTLSLATDDCIGGYVQSTIKLEAYAAA
jgi:hypothetical protein